MSISDSPRFINTPTLLEEYHEDQKGYDSLFDDDTKVQLSREYDRVSGNEEFYKAIFSHVSLPSVNSVSGNEGFFDAIKKGISAFIQAVKDFFKGMFSFFTGKKEVAARKTSNLELNIGKHGVVAGQIPYPASIGDIYDRAKGPGSSLAWMRGALDDCIYAVKQVEAYLVVLKKGTQAITDAALNKITDEGSVDIKKEHDQMVSAAREALEIKELNTPSSLYGRVEIQMDATGKLKEVPDDLQLTKDAKFNTDQSEIERLLVKHKELLKAADTMLENSMQIENTSLKALNALMNANKNLDVKGTKKFTAAADEIQSTVRHAMANLKLLQTIIYRSIFASTAVLTAATAKKG